jgi:hypothetical protein
LSLQLLKLLLEVIEMRCRNLIGECGKFILSIIIGRDVIDRDKHSRLG